ncbi:MAG: hypothetical protein QOF48_2841 [Verrucomicrobiota bacterium]|jgi:hypothetical protein
MPHAAANVRCFVVALAAFFLGLLSGSSAPIRDGGIDPANLGKGDWIYFLSAATNKLGGNVPGVVNIPTLMAYYKSQGMKYFMIKVGTGSTNFNGSGSSWQLSSNLVYQAHAAGLWIFPYTRSYGDDVQGEINMASACFALGADGWVIDAEAEWESSRLGANGPALATQYGNGLRALFPTKFIAHAPFPIISFHSSFPYREFGLFCDTVMPQAYWKSIYGNNPNAVGIMFTNMNNEYRTWQGNLTGNWTNAIKPLAPIAQGYSPATNEITTGAEIDEFYDRLRTNPNPASVTGYKGISFWRADLHTPDMWPAIGTNSIGDLPGPPIITGDPQSKTVPMNSTASFAVAVSGSAPFAYQWRFNAAPIAGGTNSTLTLPLAQPADAGGYSVRVTNSLGWVTSSVAMLVVTTPPGLFNVTALAGSKSAIISWQSTNAASSQVGYGLSTNLGMLTLETFPLQTNHSVLLAGLAANTLYFFSVISRAGTNTLRLDGGSFSTAGDLIVDNADATYTGSWITANSAGDKFGTDYRYVSVNSTGSTASALFTPLIITRGRYDVFVWHPQGANRPTNASVTVYFSGGAVNSLVNQTINGGRWVQVATNVNFISGSSGFVRVSNVSSDTGKVVMADAVRFVYRADQDAPPSGSVPDWWAWYYFGSNTNALADSDSDGYANWMEYLAGTDPTHASSRLTFGLVPAEDGTVRASFAPFTRGRSYQLQQRMDAGSWLTLTNIPVNLGTNADGKFTVTNDFETLRILRLKVDWLP